MSDYFDKGWFWAVSEKGEVWTRKNIDMEFEEMCKTRQAYLSKSAAEIAAPLIVERVALKSRIAELEAMQKQMMNGCDGHCALDECVCEKDQRVVDLQDHVRELEAMIAAKDESLRFYADYKGNWETHHWAECSLVGLDLGSKARKVLALTPADVVDMSYELIRNQEPLGEPFSSVLYDKVGKMTEDLADEIEASRAAGVEVKDVAL